MNTSQLRVLRRPVESTLRARIRVADQLAGFDGVPFSLALPGRHA